MQSAVPIDGAISGSRSEVAASTGFKTGTTIDANAVKRLARELGADLVGIASAGTLNAFPPDPQWPQTPERISPHCKSVIVIVQRIPVGAFRCKYNTAVQYIDMLVLRKMDKIAYRLASEMERAGHPTFVTTTSETEWTYKRASYARLSTRHLGVEAGLGTLGLEVNILTPEFGPRVYLTGILTELELEPDSPMQEQYASANRAAAACILVPLTQCCTLASTSASALRSRRSLVLPAC